MTCLMICSLRNNGDEPVILGMPVPMLDSATTPGKIVFAICLCFHFQSISNINMEGARIGPLRLIPKIP